MNRAWLLNVLFASLMTAVGVRALAAADQAAPRPALKDNPFAAHNAYPWRLYPKDRFDKALASGLKHLEVDVTYDAKRRAVVATHDARPNGREPELESLLGPLWKKWGAAADDGYTLIIDLKTSSSDLAQGLQTILLAHQELLSTMPKHPSDNPSADFRPGKITVCLTGSGGGHRAYAGLIPDDGTYLAFSDDAGCPGSWQSDVASYVPREPPGFVRFLTYEKHNFLDTASAHGDDRVSSQRLSGFMKLADQAGYRVRIYTIDPTRGRDGEWGMRYWDACIGAGVHMIATDAYDLARTYWQDHVAAAKQR